MGNKKKEKKKKNFVRLRTTFAKYVQVPGTRYHVLGYMRISEGQIIHLSGWAVLLSPASGRVASGHKYFIPVDASMAAV